MVNGCVGRRLWWVRLKRNVPSFPLHLIVIGVSLVASSYISLDACVCASRNSPNWDLVAVLALAPGKMLECLCGMLMAKCVCFCQWPQNARPDNLHNTFSRTPKMCMFIPSNGNVCFNYISRRREFCRLRSAATYTTLEYVDRYANVLQLRQSVWNNIGEEKSMQEKKVELPSIMNSSMFIWIFWFFVSSEQCK